ncbi:hypothetical protein HZB74_02870, partial [Candidatus Saccharibacteria bacterium]|nr:hypothetical protein [Candidatus Saccharibacteria bacterium]
MKKLNQSGYGIIEILLIIVALTIVGGTGFYVYNANKDSSKSQQESSIAKKEAKEDEVVQATADPTKDWKIYKSKHGFSIKYPQNWKLNENNIEEYADLPKKKKNGRDHFSL